MRRLALPATRLQPCMFAVPRPLWARAAPHLRLYSAVVGAQGRPSARAGATATFPPPAVVEGASDLPPHVASFLSQPSWSVSPADVSGVLSELLVGTVSDEWFQQGVNPAGGEHGSPLRPRMQAAHRVLAHAARGGVLPEEASLVHFGTACVLHAPELLLDTWAMIVGAAQPRVGTGTPGGRAAPAPGGSPAPPPLPAATALPEAAAGTGQHRLLDAVCRTMLLSVMAARVLVGDSRGARAALSVLRRLVGGKAVLGPAVAPPAPAGLPSLPGSAPVLPAHSDPHPLAHAQAQAQVQAQAHAQAVAQVEARARARRARALLAPSDSGAPVVAGAGGSAAWAGGSVPGTGGPVAAGAAGTTAAPTVRLATTVRWSPHIWSCAAVVWACCVAEVPQVALAAEVLVWVAAAAPPLPLAKLMRLQLPQTLVGHLASGRNCTTTSLPVIAVSTLMLCQEVGAAQGAPALHLEPCEVASLWWHRRPLFLDQPLPAAGSDLGFELHRSFQEAHRSAAAAGAGGMVSVRVVDAVARSCFLHMPLHVAVEHVALLLRVGVLDGPGLAAVTSWLAAGGATVAAVGVLERIVVKENLALPRPLDSNFLIVLRAAAGAGDVCLVAKVGLAGACAACHPVVVVVVAPSLALSVTRAFARSLQPVCCSLCGCVHLCRRAGGRARCFPSRWPVPGPQATHMRCSRVWTPRRLVCCGPLEPRASRVTVQPPAPEQPRALRCCSCLSSTGFRWGPRP